MKDTEIRKSVRENYGKIAKEGGSCCSEKSRASCCGRQSAEDISKSIGYTEADMNSVPEGANLGLGCGNPIALASLKEAETVLDLGSGAGFDCFLAANSVGAKGKVIGVDMTPDMIEKARENAIKNNYSNVEFRLGEIEALPVGDNSVDVILSNCVINLSVDKERVFQEAYRVLKPGGRMLVSDIVITKELSDAVRESVQAYIGCISGAMLEEDYLGTIEEAGFQDVSAVDESGIATNSLDKDPIAQSIAESLNLTSEEMETLASSIKSIKVSALKSKVSHQN